MSELAPAPRPTKVLPNVAAVAFLPAWNPTYVVPEFPPPPASPSALKNLASLLPIVMERPSTVVMGSDSSPICRMAALANIMREPPAPTTNAFESVPVTATCPRNTDLDREVPKGAETRPRATTLDAATPVFNTPGPTRTLSDPTSDVAAVDPIATLQSPSPPAPYPTIALLFPVTSVSPTRVPKIAFLDPVVIIPASYPTAVLSLPVVRLFAAYAPTRVLRAPVTLADPDPASYPTTVFSSLWILRPELYPTNVLELPALRFPAMAPTIVFESPPNPASYPTNVFSPPDVSARTTVASRIPTTNESESVGFA